MSRIKRLVRPEINSMNWKTAVTLLLTTVAGLTMAANAAVPAANPQALAPVDVVESEVAMAVAAKPEKESVKPVARKKEDVVVPALIDFEKKGCRPEYPRSALRNELQGRTTLAVTIAKSGRVAEVKVIGSSGHETLDDAVKTQLLSGSCKVTPGTINGVIQKTTKQVQYLWKLDADDRAKKRQSTLVSTPEKSNALAVKNDDASIDFNLPGCKPEYPRASRRNEETGTTRLNVHVTEAGAISGVDVLVSSGFRGLDNAVRTQLLQGLCKVQPAVQDGKVVAASMNVAYVWRLD